MDKRVIEVKNLSKMYKIGHIESYPTLRDSITNIFKKKVRKEIFWALKDISLDVHKGEVVGVIGRNGAGKTTLLKILSRITFPTTGEIKIRGRVASLLEVGTGFHPELTGNENIYLNGAILGMKKNEINKKFEDIVEFSGVEKFLDTPIKRYSSGMYVRLAFSVAAHLEPEILLIDEVLAVGDIGFQKKCLNKMEDVSQSGRTILFVSHNMNTIQKLCEKSILLNDGKIQNMGSTNDIIDVYLSEMDELVTETSLAQRKDRKGNGSLQFTNVTFENLLGEIIKHPSSGEDIRIILDYECKDKILMNVLVSLELLSNGLRFAHFDTYLTNQNFKEIPLKGRFILTIPKLPLMPGGYSITLYSTSNMIQTDWIKDAAFLHVKDGRYFKSGSIPPNHAAKILIDHYWDVNGL